MRDFEVIVQKELDDVKRIGIVRAHEWFHIFNTWAKPPDPEMVHPDDYVVCKWSWLYGENQNGKTIAICRNIKDAYLLYNLKIKKYEKVI